MQMKVHIFSHVCQGEGYDVSITSLCKSTVDCFANNETVVGSIPTEAPFYRTCNLSLFFTVARIESIDNTDSLLIR